MVQYFPPSQFMYFDIYEVAIILKLDSMQLMNYYGGHSKIFANTD